MLGIVTAGLVRLGAIALIFSMLGPWEFYQVRYESTNSAPAVYATNHGAKRRAT